MSNVQSDDPSGKCLDIEIFFHIILHEQKALTLKRLSVCLVGFSKHEQYHPVIHGA